MKKNNPRPKSAIGRIWYFIWDDDSVLSWIVNIILAIVLIKFVVYPGLGLALGTEFPVVAVVSDSMEHENPGKTQKLGFEKWWEVRSDFYKSKNITPEQFRHYPFHNGFNKGDLMVLSGAKPSEIKKGDILVFKGWRPDPIIHRVVDINNTGKGIFFETKGDNNKEQISPHNSCMVCDETQIHESQIVGKAVLRVPYLGWVKIAAV